MPAQTPLPNITIAMHGVVDVENGISLLTPTLELGN